MNDDNAHFAPVDPVKAGLSCRCPRCGQGRLYDGLVKLRPSCMICGLDYAFADAGDGPVVFVVLIADFLLLGMALWVQAHFAPPVWVQILLWGPMAVVVSLGLLRTIKSLLIALQYRNNARQGTIDRD